MNRMFFANAMVTVGLLSAFGFGQAKPAEYHSAAELKREFGKLSAQAKAKNSGSAGADPGAYDNHALQPSYRRETGGAGVQSHFDDIMLVQAGSARLVTGGSLTDPEAESNGEIKGKSIDGGTRQVLAVGDVVHIPAGAPRQLLLDDGADFRALVIKICESFAQWSPFT